MKKEQPVLENFTAVHLRNDSLLDQGGSHGNREDQQDLKSIRVIELNCVMDIASEETEDSVDS